MEERRTMTQPTQADSRAGAAARQDMFAMTGPSFTEALVDPGGVFREPVDVAEHPGFTHEEKRTILVSWARDELVIEQVAKKSLPELRPRSRIDTVLEALQKFDRRAAAEYRAAVASIRSGHPGRPAQATASLTDTMSKPWRP